MYGFYLFSSVKLAGLESFLRSLSSMKLRGSRKAGGECPLILLNVIEIINIHHLTTMGVECGLFL